MADLRRCVNVMDVNRTTPFQYAVLIVIVLAVTALYYGAGA